MIWDRRRLMRIRCMTSFSYKNAAAESRWKRDWWPERSE